MSKIKDFLSRFISKYKNFFIFVLALLIYCFLMNITGIHCPIRYVTGVSCAGCGMTRAYMSLLKGDFAGAFHYHPLFILPPIVAIVIINKGKIKPFIYNFFMFTVIAAFVIIYVYRMVHGGNDVVVFEPENGLIGRMIHLIKYYSR